MVRYILDLETREVVEGRQAGSEDKIIKRIKGRGYKCFALFRSKTHAINFARAQVTEEPTSIYCPQPQFDDEAFLKELNDLKRVRYHHMEMVVKIGMDVVIYDPYTKERQKRMPRRFQNLRKVKKHQQDVFTLFWRKVPKDSVEFLELWKFAYVAPKQMLQYLGEWFIEEEDKESRLQRWKLWVGSGQDEKLRPKPLDYSALTLHEDRKRRESYQKRRKAFNLSQPVF